MADRALARRYDERFYANIDGPAASSADVVIPLLEAVVPVRSVVDVGCGSGAWLEAFRQRGVADILGIDGPHVDPDSLQFPRTSFEVCDLAVATPSTDRRFDLALCLEVAEHLEPERGRQLVRALTELAPAVLFSAAVPGQGGNGHVNEQWQSAWAAEFDQYGFRPIDLVRPVTWADDRVAYWYRQNCLLYCSDSVACDGPAPAALDLVHPRTWTRVAERGIAGLVQEVPAAVGRTVRRRGRRRD